MSQTQAIRIQQDLENAVRELNGVADLDEKRSLLRKIKRLIEEADRLIVEEADASAKSL
jgi:hypothetical protein